MLRRSDAPLAQAAPCRHGVSGFAAGQELDLSRGVPGRGHPWELKSGEVQLETLWLSRKPSISALHHTKCQMAKCPDAGQNLFSQGLNMLQGDQQHSLGGKS